MNGIEPGSEVPCLSRAQARIWLGYCLTGPIVAAIIPTALLVVFGVSLGGHYGASFVLVTNLWLGSVHGLVVGLGEAAVLKMSGASKAKWALLNAASDSAVVLVLLESGVPEASGLFGPSVTIGILLGGLPLTFALARRITDVPQAYLATITMVLLVSVVSNQLASFGPVGWLLSVLTHPLGQFFVRDATLGLSLWLVRARTKTGIVG